VETNLIMQLAACAHPAAALAVLAADAEHAMPPPQSGPQGRLTRRPATAVAAAAAAGLSEAARALLAADLDELVQLSAPPPPRHLRVALRQSAATATPTAASADGTACDIPTTASATSHTAVAAGGDGGGGTARAEASREDASLSTSGPGGASLSARVRAWQLFGEEWTTIRAYRARTAAIPPLANPQERHFGFDVCALPALLHRSIPL